MSKTLLVRLVLIAVLPCSGCAMWRGPATPDYVGRVAAPAVEPIPVIKVVNGHVHKMEGDRRESVEGFSGTAFSNAYNKVTPEAPVMSRASTGPAEPVHYVLFIDTQVNEHGEAMAILSGLTLMLFPVTTSSDLIVTASLYEAATGSEVAVLESKRKVNVLIWLPVLPITPFNLVLGPGKAVYEEAFADTYIQLAFALAERPLPEAIDPTRLDIRRKPDYIPREIKVL